MRSFKLLPTLLLAGALTVAAPGVASAHAEGRANCRYAMQQNSVFQLAALGRVQQTFAGVMTGIVATVEELDRSLDQAFANALEHTTAVAATVSQIASESARLVRTTVGLGSWAGANIPSPR